MRLRHALILLALAPFWMGADDNAGCQSQPSVDVNQDRIYTSYWVLYDAQTDQTFARAQFRFGTSTGTTLILSEGASVAFEGRELLFNAGLDWYEIVLDGAVDEGIFTYTDVEGATFVNQMPPLDVMALEGVPTTIAQDDNLVVTWTGDPLAEDELLEVIVASEPNRFDFEVVYVSLPGSTDAILTSNKLEQVAPGAAVVGARRNHDYPIEEGTSAGGKLTVTYQTEEIRVILD